MGASLTSRGQRLYQLIWKRTVGSQMNPQKLEISKIVLESNNTKEIFSSSGEKTIFEGHNILYQTNNNDDSLIKFVEKLSKGSEMLYKIIKAAQKYTKPKSRFSEASLIKELEKMGIGRPSTYSGIITRIQDKLYVEKKTIEGSKIDCINMELKDDKIKEKKEKVTYGG